MWWLAVKSLRAAITGRVVTAVETPRAKLFWKGFAIHLTNPKAILGWGAIYAIALPAAPSIGQVWGMFAILIVASAVTFVGYAILFSTPAIARGYRRAARVFDAAFGLLFGAAAIKVLTARLTPT